MKYKTWMSAFIVMGSILANADMVSAGEVKVQKSLRAILAWQVIDPPPILPEPIWVDKDTTFITLKLVPIATLRADTDSTTSDGTKVVSGAMS